MTISILCFFFLYTIYTAYSYNKVHSRFVVDMKLVNKVFKFYNRKQIFALFSSNIDSIVSRVKVKKILESDLIGKEVLLQGWVRTVRDQKQFSFIEINDGSSLTSIQAIAESEIETYKNIELLTTGAAVEVVV